MPEICMRDGLVVVDGVPDVNAPAGAWPFPGQEDLNTLHVDPDLGLWVPAEPLRSDSQFTEISLEITSSPLGGSEVAHDNRSPYNTAFGVDDPFARMFHFKHTNPESCSALNRIVSMTVVVTLLPQDNPYSVGVTMDTSEPMSTTPQVASFPPWTFGDPVTVSLDTSLVTRLETDSPLDFYMLLEVIQTGEPRQLSTGTGTLSSGLVAGAPEWSKQILAGRAFLPGSLTATGGINTLTTVANAPASSVRSVELYYDIALLGAEGVSS